MGPYLFSAGLFLLALVATGALALLVRERARQRLQAIERRLDRIEAGGVAAPGGTRVERLAARVRAARREGRFSPAAADRLLEYLHDLDEELREG